LQHFKASLKRVVKFLICILGNISYFSLMIKKIHVFVLILGASLCTGLLAADDAVAREAKRSTTAKTFQTKNINTFSVFVKGFC